MIFVTRSNTSAIAFTSLHDYSRLAEKILALFFLRHHHAAVNMKRLSGHVARGVGSEESDDAGDIIRLAKAGERNLRLTFPPSAPG